MMTARDTINAPALVGQLVGLGVELPEEMTRTADQVQRLRGLRPPPAPPTDLLGLTDSQLTDVLTDLAISCVARVDASSGPGAEAIVMLDGAMRTALADALAGHADAILDQLRPAFEAAAESVHATTRLGIHPGTTDRDIVKGDDVGRLADAWTSLPAQVRILESIAAVRISLSETAGVVPCMTHAWPPIPNITEIAGAMFRTDAPAWRPDQYETDWQRWVRLCTLGPVRLLTLAETEEALQGSADEYSPFVDDHVEEVVDA